ncbi:MAG: trypsin-like peptidase domain-containing protein, partial [Pirellulales bacterium]|nr:trypsin-like peptidase domain-containing protein [Pirellulales bacterium]
MISHLAAQGFKSSRERSGRFAWIVLLVILAFSVLPTGAPVWADSGPADAASDDKKNAVPKTLEQLRSIEKCFEKVSTKAIKCVVGIQIGSSRGSGVLISPEGLILTAGHVAQKPGAAATITTSDGKKFKGVSLGVFLSADAGMMKLNDKGPWPYLELEVKEAEHVGDWCLALGHPLGYQPGRPPVVRMGRVLHQEERTIQTDCPLIVGDSGGPLVSLDGKVIGINSRISGPMSMNYHVSADVFHDYWDRLKKGHIWTDGTLRDAAAVKAAFREVVAKTAPCVVRVRCDKKDAALGTIVGPDGWILTKASELKGRVVVRLADGRDLEARTIGVNPRFDLAMLKIDAVDLPKISWQLKDPDVGQWVAVPGLGEDPLAIGVVSVPRRPIPHEKGTLGVLIQEMKKGVTVVNI